MKKIMLSVCVTAAIVITGCGGSFSGSKTSIAYVNKNTVIQEYNLAKQVREQIQTSIQQTQKELEAKLAAANEKIEAYKVKLSEAEKAKKEERVKELTELIQMTANSYNENKKSMETKISTANESISKDVLQKIDAFIVDYGKKQGYTMIFDVTSGVLYKDDAVDVTQHIIDGLNK